MKKSNVLMTKDKNHETKTISFLSSRNVHMCKSLFEKKSNAISKSLTMTEAQEIENTEEEIPEIHDTEDKKVPLVFVPYPEKIVVHFRPVANAPILKQKKFKVGSDKQFFSLVVFLKTQLKQSPQEELVGCSKSKLLTRYILKYHIYCNQAFCPEMDQRIGDLYECFKVSTELILYYSLTPAWG
ncbi:hypothetical protein RFI_05435 [Reticulomyxa filosa]|uniref:Ubiquitin-like protein ATG12 n=1 Tax=Reticulomyxa filosa TaxID=46433 RepID=X6P0S8_RETFI|nr:hypothetical protein RFI_05435 [Reticulomyxa filosa]|eukprot:ETO31684.1 hypothetical protein RFI_05435 [Reticulomyxa filosa]